MPIFYVKLTTIFFSVDSSSVVSIIAPKSLLGIKSKDGLFLLFASCSKRFLSPQIDLSFFTIYLVCCLCTKSMYSNSIELFNSFSSWEIDILGNVESFRLFCALIIFRYSWFSRAPAQNKLMMHASLEPVDAAISSVM